MVVVVVIVTTLLSQSYSNVSLLVTSAGGCSGRHSSSVSDSLSRLGTVHSTVAPCGKAVPASGLAVHVVVPSAFGFETHSTLSLFVSTPAAVLEAYARPALSIGMRGHAQMIPFGCRRPIVSLISHEKLKWFLEDIGAEDWGVELDEPDLADRLSALALEVLDRLRQLRARTARRDRPSPDTDAQRGFVLGWASGRERGVEEAP